MLNLKLEVKPIPDQKGRQTILFYGNGSKEEIQKLKFDIMAIVARYNREAKEKEGGPS